jgi:hypothetical protein
MTATGSGLNTRRDSRQHRHFSLRQAIGRIRGQAAGVSNVRCDTGARSSIAERHYVNLCPLNASRSSCWSERTCWSGRVIDPERFDTVYVAILILHHRAVGERVGVIAAGRLWHRVSSRNIRGLADVHRPNKCRTSRSCVIGTERKNVPGVRRGRFRDHIVRCSGRRRCSSIIARQQTENLT